MSRILNILVIFIACAAFTSVIEFTPVYAHGFGQRYDLPLPLWLYVSAAGAAVLLSFAFIGFFASSRLIAGRYFHRKILATTVRRSLPYRSILGSIQVTSVFATGLVIASGLFGTQVTVDNIAPTMIWVIWWVGLAFASALFGNIWALINPWKITFSWAENAYRWIRPSQELSLHLPYPNRWGTWPAFLFFVLFAWLEIVYPNAAEPKQLAIFIILYTGFTWTGMFLFGRHVWLRNGETFSILFGLFSKISPTETRTVDRQICELCSSDCRTSEHCIDCYECNELGAPTGTQLNVRPFGAGLLDNLISSSSKMALVLLVLATVSFDGFTATPVWASLVENMGSIFEFLGSHLLTATTSLGLVVFAAIFAAAFTLVARIMAWISAEGTSTMALVKTFVISLIPIALAYHLAHFLSFLLIQGQLILPLLSDPFGRGWNLWGTADFTVNLTIVDARFAWAVAVTAIVVGHILAVYVSHIAALRIFKTHAQAIKSQYPMLGLMVGYTMLSLWVLAQPITE